MALHHLLNETMLDEYLSSPRRDRAILNHVRQCPQCQATARSGRLMRLLLHKPTSHPPDGHLSSSELASFCEEKLNDLQTIHVMEHLKQCDRCLAEFGQLHQALAEASQVSDEEATPDLARVALAAFSPKGGQAVAGRPGWGRLVIERLHEGYQLLLQPSRELTGRIHAMDFPMEDALSVDAGPELTEPAAKRADYEDSAYPLVQQNMFFRRELPRFSTDPVSLTVEGRDITIKDYIRGIAHELHIDVAGEPAPFELTLVTVEGEETHRAMAGETLHLPLPQDALALRFGGKAFKRGFELDLALPED